jgi:hypothetical protein
VILKNLTLFDNRPRHHRLTYHFHPHRHQQLQGTQQMLAQGKKDRQSTESF